MKTCEGQCSKDAHIKDSIKYKGIIFDFNGVLLWDSHFHEIAWKEFSTTLRGHPLTSEEIFNHVHGKTNKKVLDYILSRPVSSQEFTQLSSQKEANNTKILKIISNFDHFAGIGKMVFLVVS